MAAIVITPRNLGVYHLAGLSLALDGPFPGRGFRIFTSELILPQGKPHFASTSHQSTPQSAVDVSSNRRRDRPRLHALFSRLVCSSSDRPDS